MKLQQIRNATMKITYGTYTFLLDPWLQDQGTGMCARVVRAEMAGVKSPLDILPLSTDEINDGVDYYLLSHHHPDHYTKDYLSLDIPFITQNEGDLEKVKTDGFTGMTFKNNQLIFNETTIIRVDGKHGDNDDCAKVMGEVSGFIFQNPHEPTLYIAGDTIYYEEVKNTIEKYQPDVITVNCCEATTPRGRLIMNKEDVLSVLSLSDATVVATHLDSVNHALLNKQDYKNMKQEMKLENLVVPNNADILTFNS